MNDSDFVYVSIFKSYIFFLFTKTEILFRQHLSYVLDKPITILLPFLIIIFFWLCRFHVHRCNNASDHEFSEIKNHHNNVPKPKHPLWTPL